MKIRYSDFWDGFSPENFFLTHLIHKATLKWPEIIRNREEMVDFEIFSSFPYSSTRDKVIERVKFNFSDQSRLQYVSKATFGHQLDYTGRARRRIWFSGENLRPPVSQFDLMLSFEKTDPILNNIYFPYWMTRINWGYSGSSYEIFPTPQELMANRKIFKTGNSTCVFSSNLEPGRQRIINATERVFPISKYGSAYGQRVTSKARTSREFMFQICNENDLYPGYVTEKLQESWLVGNIPIWAGLLPSDHNFNLDSFIDVTELTFEEISTKLKDMKEDEITYRLNQPLHTQLASIDEVEKAVQNLL